jgi:hypothetical protein
VLKGHPPKSSFADSFEVIRRKLLGDIYVRGLSTAARSCSTIALGSNAARPHELDL